MKIILTIIGVLIVIAGIGWIASHKQTVDGELGVAQKIQEDVSRSSVDPTQNEQGSPEGNAVGDSDEPGGISVSGALPDNAVKELPKVCGDYEPVVENVPAPDFTLLDRKGATMTLAQYKDQKPVILDFWNTWCHNCQRDMPQLNTLYNESNQAVEVLGINILPNNDRESSIDRFVDSNGLDFPILIDRDGAVANSYGIRFTSTKVLINTEGTVFDVFADDITEQQLQCFTEFNNA